MPSYDVKKELKHLYAPTAGEVAVVEVPEMGFLMVDGHGDPNSSAAYREAVQALFTLSYAIRAEAKRALGRVHTVTPLEGRGLRRTSRSSTPGTRARGTGR